MSEESWQAEHLPEELRSDESLSEFKSIGDLGKSFVEQKKLLGRKRLELPREDWGDSDWQGYWKNLGRPDTPEGYLKDFKPEGIELSPDRMAAVKKEFYDSGLSEKQAQRMMDYYVADMKGMGESAAKQQEEAATKALEGLKSDWGADFQPNLDRAKGFFAKHADDEMIKFMEESGLGNNVNFLKLMLKFSSLDGEDNGAGGEGSGTMTPEKEAIQKEIDGLRNDKDFMEAYLTQHHAGHRAAVKRMSDLRERLHSV